MFADMISQTHSSMEKIAKCLIWIKNSPGIFQSQLKIHKATDLPKGDFPFREACRQKTEEVPSGNRGAAPLFQSEHEERMSAPELIAAAPLSLEKDYRRSVIHTEGLDYSGSSNNK